jgi:hypothetical protein
LKAFHGLDGVAHFYHYVFGRKEYEKNFAIIHEKSEWKQKQTGG